MSKQLPVTLDGQPIDDVKDMSFVEHLEELRWHIIRSLLAMVVLSILAFIFTASIFDYIIFAPKSSDFLTYRVLCTLSYTLGLGSSLCLEPKPFVIQNIQLMGQFLTNLKISIVLGFVVAFPYVFWEIWRFVRPGLYQNERQVTRGLVFYSSALFFMGILFGYFILAPFSINFFSTYNVSAQVENIIALDSYISVITTLILASGIMFELPMVVYLLSRLGLVTPQGMREYRKHSFLAILIVASVITPPDVFTQILVTIPVYGLYELSIFVSARVQPK